MFGKVFWSPKKKGYIYSLLFIVLCSLLLLTENLILLNKQVVFLILDECNFWRLSDMGMN